MSDVWWAGLAGLPDGVCGATANRWVWVGHSGGANGAGALAMDAGEAFICGGVESMSRVPMYGFNLRPPTAWNEQQASDYLDVGLSAERVAERYRITRAEQDLPLTAKARP